MKKNIILLLIICLFCTINLKAQSIRVIKCNTENITSLPQYLFMKSKIDSTNNLKEYYRIEILDSSDTIQLVNDLLKLEGDTRLLCMPILCNSDVSSSLYMGKQELSVQVYALYLIWGLYFDYKATAGWAVLTENGQQETVKGEIVKQAFTSYKKWFKNNSSDLKKNKPLDYCNVRWLL